jgi:hypothetical protein
MYSEWSVTDESSPNLYDAIDDTSGWFTRRVFEDVAASGNPVTVEPAGETRSGTEIAYHDYDIEGDTGPLAAPIQARHDGEQIRITRLQYSMAGISAVAAASDHRLRFSGAVWPAGSELNFQRLDGPSQTVEINMSGENWNLEQQVFAQLVAE